MNSPVDVIDFDEASPNTDIIIRHPLPLCTASQDWKYVVYGVPPPTLGDAGLAQAIWNDLIYLYPDWNFEIPTRLLLDFSVQALAHLIEEESLISINKVLGREGGKALFLGSKPHRLTFYLLCTEEALKQITSRNTFSIELYKYGQSWWQGSARTKQLAEVRREPGTPSEIIHVLWSLEGHVQPVSDIDFGICDADAGSAQQVFQDLIYLYQDWNFKMQNIPPPTQPLSGDAGLAQQIYQELVYLLRDWGFKLIMSGEFGG